MALTDCRETKDREVRIAAKVINCTALRPRDYPGMLAINGAPELLARTTKVVITRTGKTLECRMIKILVAVIRAYPSSGYRPES
jgi:hypothetical protein